MKAELKIVSPEYSKRDVSDKCTKASKISQSSAAYFFEFCFRRIQKRKTTDTIANAINTALVMIMQRCSLEAMSSARNAEAKNADDRAQIDAKTPDKITD